MLCTSKIIGNFRLPKPLGHVEEIQVEISTPVSPITTYKLPCAAKRILFSELSRKNFTTYSRYLFPNFPQISKNRMKTNYLDLINGPANRGNCSSSKCVTRLNAFFAIVARNKKFLLYFTKTPPQNMRFSILQPDSTYAVRLGIDYSVSGRLDVYADGKYVLPLNGAYNDKVSN